MNSLSLEECLRLDEVQRWGIVATSRPQSVAGHSAVVAHAALELAAFLEVFQGDQEQAQIMRYALFHDAAEIYTGDMPAPTKQEMNPDDVWRVEAKLCPVAVLVDERTPSAIRKLVKVADAWEGFVFAMYYATGPQALRVREFMFKYLRERAQDLADTLCAEIEKYSGLDSGSVYDVVMSNLLADFREVRPNAN